MLTYHDEEWGVPSHDDTHLFELLTLEGAQAGLSWSTILNKRDGYRRAFAGFDAEAVARFGPEEVERLLADPGIVRNRLKVASTIENAARILEVRDELGSFDAYLWAFVDGEPIVGRWKSLAELPAETDLSRALSRDLKKRGFRFVGPTVCYAFMQAVGHGRRPHGRLLPFRRLISRRAPARGRPRAPRRPRARPTGAAVLPGSRSPSQRWRLSIVEFTPPRLVAFVITRVARLDRARVGDVERDQAREARVADALDGRMLVQAECELGRRRGDQPHPALERVEARAGAAPPRPAQPRSPCGRARRAVAPCARGRA